MARPTDLRIDDLAQPRFDPAITEMMKQVVEATGPVQFTPKVLLDAACAETGLDDFGDEGFLEPLAHSSR